MYDSAVSPFMVVADAGSWREETWTWNNAIVTGSAEDTMTDLLLDMLHMLAVAAPQQGVEDESEWARTDGKAFSVKSCANRFRQRDCSVSIDEVTKSALSFLWKLKASSNILTFGWRLILNRLPTRDQLRRRGIGCPL